MSFDVLGVFYVFGSYPKVGKKRELFSCSLTLEFPSFFLCFFFFFFFCKKKMGDLEDIEDAFHGDVCLLFIFVLIVLILSNFFFLKKDL